ncbi:ester cyclase [bacterium BMS3Abin03]|nr:ester cyclase [bacterium BMS3Abin03]
MKKHNLLFLLIALLVVVLYDCDNTSERLEANKNLILRFTEATNAADWNAFDELLTQDFKRHCQATPNLQVNSREGFKRLQESFLASMPDQKITVKMLIAEGDKVAGYATYSGTLTGPMGEFPATGKSVESKFLSIFRIEEGRIAELWVEWDNLAMLTQLGLFPPPVVDK